MNHLCPHSAFYSSIREPTVKLVWQKLHSTERIGWEPTDLHLTSIHPLNMKLQPTRFCESDSGFGSFYAIWLACTRKESRTTNCV